MNSRTPDEFFEAVRSALGDPNLPAPEPSADELMGWGADQVHRLQRQIDTYCLLRHSPPLVRLSGQSASATPPFGEVPGYQLGRTIAAGGQSTVFEAQSIAGGKRAAVKIYGRIGGQISKEDRLRADDEAESLQAMDHPRIVRLLDRGDTSDGCPFLVLEFIDGPSLAGVIRPSMRYEARHVALFVHSLTSAVQHAHQRGVVHRDIKPANILLRNHGRSRGLEEASPVLIDFGIASIAGDRPRATTMGMHPGTLPYMAPEQVDPETFGKVTPATDVRGLGLVLFELLDGAPAFSGTLSADIRRSITRLDVLHLEKRLRGADESLATICLRAMEARPRDRYTSAKAMAQDLELFLGKKPIEAQRPGLFSRAYRRCRPHLLGIAAASVLLAAMVTLGVSRVNESIVEDRIANLLDVRSSSRAVTRLEQAAQNGIQDEILRAAWPLADSYLHITPAPKEAIYVVRLLNQVAYEARDLDRPRARECAGRALEISKSFGFDSPAAAPGERFEAARSASYHGRALALAGQGEEACSVMEEAARQFAALDLSAGTEDLPGGHMELALIWNNLGNTLSGLEDPSCDEAYERAIEILRVGAETDHECRVWLVKALTNRGLHARDLTVSTVLSLHREAVEYAEGYIVEVRDARLRSDPDVQGWLRFDLDYREGLGIALTNWAEALEESGSPEAAIPLMERALAVYADLANALASHREFPWSEAMAQTDLGNLLAIAGPRERYPEALELVSRARLWYDGALERWPDEPWLADYSLENEQAIEAIEAVLVTPGRDLTGGR